MADLIALSGPDLAEVRAEVELIQKHRQTASFLERDLYSALERKYNIDLKAEGWSLNIDQGILTRDAEISGEESRQKDGGSVTTPRTA